MTDSAFSKFSKRLFWDVSVQELDLERHRRFIVQRVLGHGVMDDWRQLLKCYTLEGVVETAQSLRALDPKTLSFVASVGGVPRESFRCFSTKLSNQPHWIP